MSGTHLHLPTIDELKRQMGKDGLENFVKAYSSYRFLIGESECISFVEEMRETYKKERYPNGKGGCLLNS